MLFDLNQIAIPIFLVGVEVGECFRMLGMNRTAERMFGYPAARVVGRTFPECFNPRMAALLTEHYGICLHTREAHQFDDFADLADGRKWFRTTLSPCIDAQTDRVTQIMALSQNITSVMQRFEEAEAFAFTDALTGLPNRRRFDEAVENACDEAIYTSRGFSVCIVDLDDLKGINDAFGHQAGDEAIRCVAHVLRQFVQADELAARIGGDEFALLIRAEDTLALAERLAALDGLVSPGVPIPGWARLAHGSAGGALWRPGDTVKETLRLADAAMYAEKCRRRGVVAR